MPEQRPGIRWGRVLAGGILVEVATILAVILSTFAYGMVLESEMAFEELAPS